MAAPVKKHFKRQTEGYVMTKRIIALAVTVVLILDIFPIAPFADGAEDG